jgi:phage terminase small subunit
VIRATLEKLIKNAMSQKKSEIQKKQENTGRKDREPKPSTAFTPESVINKIPTAKKEYLLDSYSKSLFKKFCQILINQNRLTETELISVVELATAYKLKQNALIDIDKRGQYILINNGMTEIRNPGFQTVKEQSSVITKLRADLCINVLGIQKLNFITPEEDDPAAEYLKNGQ